MNNIKTISFSKGIRADEIEHNFTAIQGQLNKERISVAGSGISSGFNFSISDFTLSIDEGCLISSTGEEVYVNKANIFIEKPILINTIEKLVVADDDYRVTLDNIPYANNRLQPVEELYKNNEIVDSRITGINVNLSGMMGESSKLKIVNVEKNVVTLDLNVLENKKSKLDINYNYTFRRRDVIYIDNNYEIQCKIGITSPSPSIPDMNEDEYIYILGYVLVESMYEEEGKITSKAMIEKEFKSVRNVYTDENNKLYLEGIPFDQINTIHGIQPENPADGTLWYDNHSNKLKVWRHTDIFNFVDGITYLGVDIAKLKVETKVPYLCNQGQLKVYLNEKLIPDSSVIEGNEIASNKDNIIYSSEFTIVADIKAHDKISYKIERFDGFSEWVAVNDMSYVELEERKLWTPEMIENLVIDKEFDKALFLFDYNKDINMRYIPNTNALSIMIDQIHLHSDQFKEVTLQDAIVGKDSKKLRELLSKYYGYAEKFENLADYEKYENMGIGFKLDAQLLKDHYVEGIVKHRVNANPLSNRFQRSASFVEEEYEIYQEYIQGDTGTVYQKPIFTTKSRYRYDENQLEVFLNGVKLIKNKDYIEIKNKDDIKGSSVNQFEINEVTGIKSGDSVSYRVTTNIYSYDHVESLLTAYTKDLTSMETTVEQTVNTVKEALISVDNKIEVIEDHIENISNLEANMNNTFINKKSKIGKENIENRLYSGIAQENFYETIRTSKINDKIDITAICTDKDYVQVFNTSANGGNVILRKGIEFSITIEQGRSFLNIESNTVEVGSHLYITGIRFNRA